LWGVQALNELLEDDDKFGFIVMDGLGCLYGTLSGNTREVLHRFTVRLCACKCAWAQFH
jgi:peptide chain release factor subunit 1